MTKSIKSITDNEHSQSYASSRKNHRVDKRTYEQRKKTLQCDKPHCGQIVSSQSAMIKHMQRVHGAPKATRTTTLNTPKTRMFVWNKKCQCPVRGCKKVLTSKGATRLHFKAKGQETLDRAACTTHREYYYALLESNEIPSEDEVF